MAKKLQSGVVSFVVKGGVGCMRVQWRCTEQQPADLRKLGGENDSKVNVREARKRGNEKMQKAMESNLDG